MDIALRCFHCGESVPPSAPMVEIDGAQVLMCCEGCGAAARWIRDAGLGDYYRLRRDDAPRVETSADDYAAWEHPEVMAQHARPVPGGYEITVVSHAMRCAACAWLIDRALMQLYGVSEVSANAVTGRIRFQWDPARIALRLVLQHLAALGFVPHLANGSVREDARRRERRQALLRIGVAGLGAMQAMMFSEALYLDVTAQMAASTRDFLRWMTFVVSTPVVFYAGWPFLAGLWRELRARHPGMDTLVGSSILLAYGASLFETLRGGPHVWYDAAVMFVFLLLTARQLEAWARTRASARVDALARAKPSLAWREAADGSRQQVPAAMLAPGDGVCVAVGDALPADGALLSDSANLDESLLTGEMEAVTRHAGEHVLAGSVCRETPLRLRVTRAGPQTHLSDLTRLLERAQSERPRLARHADRIASWFVVALFAIAALVFVLWWQIEPARALEATLAVLVVSCPCALSLAIPAALAAAHSRLAAMGVMSLNADALQALARADTLMLDKTGTLTEGRPRLVSTQVFGAVDEYRAHAIAAALQRDAGHPLARAFTGSNAWLAVDSMRAVAGRGVEARVRGMPCRLGRGDFAAGVLDDGAIWLGDGERPLARFQVRDELRPDAAKALAEVRALGIEPEISSGDGEANVHAVAQGLGIARTRARQSPQQKLDRIRELQQQGRRVAMLGDGINDAPVLAGADVSLAFGTGAALAHRAADFVLTGESLRRVPQAIALARRTRTIVRQNLIWALVYNLVALPFAALGWVTPWIAALGMTLSSLAVLGNALRLMREET